MKMSNSLRGLLAIVAVAIIGVAVIYGTNSCDRQPVDSEMPTDTPTQVESGPPLDTPVVDDDAPPVREKIQTSPDASGETIT